MSHNQWTTSKTCNVFIGITRSGKLERAKTPELLRQSPHLNPDSRNKGASLLLIPASVRLALESHDLLIVVQIFVQLTTCKVSTHPMTVRLTRLNKPALLPRVTETESSKLCKWSVSLWTRQSTLTTVMLKHSKEWLKMNAKPRSLPRLSVSSWLRARQATFNNKEWSN